VPASPARCLRPRSLVTEHGAEREVGVVVCATGHAAPDGLRACLGMAAPGFPNSVYLPCGPNTNIGSTSVICTREPRARHAVKALRHMQHRDRSYVAVRPSAPAAFAAKVDRWMVGTARTTRCSNYFRAPNGRPR